MKVKRKLKPGVPFTKAEARVILRLLNGRKVNYTAACKLAGRAIDVIEGYELIEEKQV